MAHNTLTLTLTQGKKQNTNSTTSARVRCVCLFVKKGCAIHCPVSVDYTTWSTLYAKGKHATHKFCSGCLQSYHAIHLQYKLIWKVFVLQQKTGCFLLHNKVFFQQHWRKTLIPTCTLMSGGYNITHLCGSWNRNANSCFPTSSLPSPSDSTENR